MTTYNSLRLYDHDRANSVINGTHPYDTLLYSFSGVLDRKREQAGVRYTALWITGACRRGKFKVIISYTLADPVEYVVEEGFPLMMETEVGVNGLTVTNITIEPIGATADVELSISISPRLVESIPPQEGLLLSLNALVGVSTDGNGVTSWLPQSGLPADSALNAVPLSQPVLVAEHPSFGGNPAVVFDGSGQALTYSGDIQDLAQLCAGESSVVVLHLPEDTYDLPRTVLSNLGIAAGTSVEITKHYRIKGIFSNDTGEGGEALSVEPIEKLLLTIFSVNLSHPTSLLTMRNQGGYVTKASSSPSPGTVATEALTLGSSPDGAQPYSGAISNVLIYDHLLSPAEIAQIISTVAQSYPLDNNFYTNNSHKPGENLAQALYLTAQRGISSVDGGVYDVNKMDLLEAFEATAGTYVNELQSATSGSGTGLALNFTITGAAPFAVLSALSLGVGGSGFATNDTIEFLGGDVLFRVIGVNEGAATEWRQEKEDGVQVAFIPDPQTSGIPPTLVEASSANGKRSMYFAPDVDDQLKDNDEPGFNRLRNMMGWGDGTLAMVLQASDTPAQFPSFVRNIFLSNKYEAAGAVNGGFLVARNGVGILNRIDASHQRLLEMNSYGLESAGSFFALVLRVRPSDYNEADIEPSGGLVTNLTLSGVPNQGVLNPLRLGGGVPRAGQNFVDTRFEGHICEVQYIEGLWDDTQIANFFAWAENKYGTPPRQS